MICFSWKRNQDVFETAKSTKQPNYPSMYITYYVIVCKNCKIDTTQASILFPFIFIVKFSDRFLSSKMWFFSGNVDRKYFSNIWTKMIPIAQFIKHFPMFWLDTLFCGHFKLYPGQKKNNFSYSLTDPSGLCLG